MNTLTTKTPGVKRELHNHWKILAIWSLALVLSPATFLFVKQPVYGLAENRLLATWSPLPKTFAQWTAYTSRLDDYVRDNFPLRTSLIVGSNTIRYLLGYSGSSLVIVGKNGWLFHDDGNHLKFWRGLRLPDAEAAAWVERFRTRLASLSRRGIQLYLLFPPYKQTIYPEKLPFWLRIHKTTELDQLMDKLKAAGLGDRLIDVRQQLLAGKSSSQLLYYKFDSHWNSHGAYIAYKRLMMRIHQDFPSLQPLPIEAFPGREQREDANLAFMLGVGKFAGTSLQRGYYPYIEPSITWLTTRRDVLAPHIIHTGVHNGRTLLLTKDSYSNALLPFVAHNFETIAVSYAGEGFFREDLIKKVQPDIVVIESIEQFCSIAF